MTRAGTLKLLTLKSRPSPRGRLPASYLLAVLGFVVLGFAATPPVAAQTATQDPAAARLLLEAERLLQGGEADAARRELELLVSQFPRDESAPRALLHLASLHRGRGDLAALDRTVDQLLENHSQAAETADGLVLAAEQRAVQARSGDALAAAQSAYRRVALLFGREAYPDLPARRRARLASGEIALRLGDAQGAAAEFLALIEDEPMSVLRGRARRGLARAFLDLGQRPAALATLERLASSTEIEATAGDRARAVRLLSLIHRRVLRPTAGERHFKPAIRFPASGLELREPTAVAAADDGRVVVVDQKLPLLVILNADGSEYFRVAVEGVERPGFLPDDRPFAVTSSNVFLPLHGTSYSFADPDKSAPLKNLFAAAPGAFDDWLVAAKGLRGALHVDDAMLPGRPVFDTERRDIVDVASGADGRLYALDAKNGEILRLDRDARSAETFARLELKRAVAIDVDALGHVFVLDRGTGQIHLLGPDGFVQTTLGPNLGGGIELRQPVDLAVDGSGRVYVADTRLPFVVRLE